MSLRRLPSMTELLAFEATARFGTVSRAAEMLNLTQSAVSRRVQQLEDHLGVALFERVRQRLVLTAAGRLYLTEVGAALKMLGEAEDRAVATTGPSVFRLATLPAFGARWLAPRLDGFRQRHPEIVVSLGTRARPFLFDQEPYDAAIHYGQADWPGTIAVRLMDGVIVPLCSARYRDALRLERPADLMRATLLHQLHDPVAWCRWFEHVGLDPSHASGGARYEEVGMLAQAAESDYGVILLPAFLLQSEIGAGKLVILFDNPLQTNNSYYFVYPREKKNQSSIVKFQKWLLNECG